MRTGLAWLAAITALMMASSASAAVVALHDDAVTNFTGQRLEQRLDLLAGTGTKVTRVDVLWRRVAPRRPASPRDPADPAYDWKQLDAIVRGLADRGIVTMFSFYTTPAWASPSGRANAAPRLADAGRFSRALATRYSGAYAPPGAQPLPEVRRIEVWNEPNLPFFYAPQCRRSGRKIVRTAPRRYSALLRVAYREIHRANTDAIVVGGVTGPASSSSRNCGADAATSALDFIAGMTRERPPLDAYAQHIYPIGSPARASFFPSWRTLGRLERALDRLKRGTPVYVTETGYHTSYNRFHRYFVSESQQAAWLDQTYRIAARRPRVELVVWFNLQDNPFWTGGLLRRDATRKPSFDRFARLATLNPPPESWTR
ncbi:MAG: hypothetical protein OEM67_09745 [Thermoleophilia bacterium]|nr:hypothetical protein [Thermoleophilia bacterium]MDH3724911.1 hypothetical protein [Thermoleophilia bacterium]